MSEEFEVKGPHEEVLEGGEGGGNSFNNRIAVITAIMATLGALLSYQASFTLSEAIMLKNEAAIRKTEAANQWNYYQAKSSKQNIAELATKVTTSKEQEKKKNDIARYISEKAEIKKKAEATEKLSLEADEHSEKFMHSHHRWATGVTMLQIAISLAAITILTRRKWLEYASLTCAGVGIVFGSLAWLGI
jgi:hypothetical protein